MAWVPPTELSFSGNQTVFQRFTTRTCPCGCFPAEICSQLLLKLVARVFFQNIGRSWVSNGPCLWKKCVWDGTSELQSVDLQMVRQSFALRALGMDSFVCAGGLYV